MEKLHTHRVGNRLRSHPVSRVHKDPKTQAHHDRTMGNKAEKVKELFKDCGCHRHVEEGRRDEQEEQSESKQPKKGNYFTIDVDTLTGDGVILNFTRMEGRNRKKVTLQIDKQ